MLCKKCVLPESKPDIRLNEEGICNVCIQHEKDKRALHNTPVLETDFVKILNRHRGKHAYDCLVMCSGGKDSTSALYYIVKRYKLRPLAYTFDHGFENEEAMRNVKNAVSILAVDFLTFSSDYMRDLFSKILSTGSPAVICHLCSLWYMRLTYDIAARFDIPLIIAGWTKGQSVKQPSQCTSRYSGLAPEYASMARAAKEFVAKHLRNDPKYKDFPSSMEEVTARANNRHEAQVLSPHWFLPFDQEANTALISRELNWKAPSLSYPRGSTNCLLNFLSVHTSMKHYGYTHYHIEMSKLIREGLLTREQALHDLEIFFDKELLNSIAARIGCSIP